jgi:hypothetical protein
MPPPSLILVIVLLQVREDSSRQGLRGLWDTSGFADTCEYIEQRCLSIKRRLQNPVTQYLVWMFPIGSSVEQDLRIA